MSFTSRLLKEAEKEKNRKEQQTETPADSSFTSRLQKQVQKERQERGEQVVNTTTRPSSATLRNVDILQPVTRNAARQPEAPSHSGSGGSFGGAGSESGTSGVYGDPDELKSRIDALTKRQSELTPLISGARRGGLSEERKRFEAERLSNAEELKRLKADYDKVRPVYTNDMAAQKVEAVKAAESALTQVRESGVDIAAEFKQKEDAVSAMEQNVQQLAVAFAQSQSEDDYNRYMEAAQQFNQAAKEYNDLLTEYKGLADSYNAAYDDYSGYMGHAKSDASGWEIAGNAVMAGIGGIAGTGRSLVDLFWPSEDWGETDPLSKFLNSQKAEQDALNAKLQESVYGRGKGVETAATIGKATVEAVPNAILALMTGGTTAAAQGTTASLQAAQAGTGLASTIGTVTNNMGKNPMYWASFAQTLGPTYEQARENGANEWQASATAFIQSALNAGVEVSGGIELLPAKLKGGNTSDIMQWVMSTPEEGVEEVIQRFVSGTVDKTIYDHDKEAFSLTDPDAIVNPVEMGKEFAMGTAVGGILGGAQIGGINAANAIIERRNNKQYGKIGSDYQAAAEDLVNEGLSFPPESEAYQTAQEVKAKLDAGETVTDTDLGRVVVANERTMQSEERLAQANAPAQTLEEAAREAVLAESEVSEEGDTSPASIKMPVREAVDAKESVPYNVMATDNPVRQTAMAEQKKLGYGEEGMKLFREIAQSNNMSETELMVRFDTPYQAGLTGLEMKNANLISDFQVEAYNAGRRDLIASMGKEHKLGAVLSEAESGFDFTGAPKSLTQAEKNFADLFLRKMGVKGSWDGKDGKANYNAFFDSSTGGVTFAQDFGIDPQLMEKLGSEDFMKKVERLESERTESFIFYVAHEVATHVAMNRAPAEMRAFVNSMYNYLQSKETGENLARSKQTFYAKNKVALDTEGAIEEVVADAILELYQGDAKVFMEAMERIANGTDEQAKKGARTFRDMLNDFIQKLKAWARKLTGKENADARANVEKGISELEQLRDMFETAISTSMKAVEQSRAGTKRDGKLIRTTEADGNTVLTTSIGNPVAMMDENGSAQFSMKTYKDSGRAELKRWLELRASQGIVTKEDAADIVRQLDEFYDLCQKFKDKYAPFGAWSDASVVTDNKGKPVFSVVKANGEYAMNLDFSLVCKKRRTLDAVFGEMIKRGMMDNVDLAEADIAKINDIIRESGFETACALCFVDAKRYRQAKVADTFVNQYNELVRMLIPEGSDVSAHHFDFVESGVYKDSGRGLHTLTDAELKAGYAKLRQVMKENGSKTVPHKIAKHLLAVQRDRKLVSRGEFMNTDGFGAVKVKNPSILKLYNSSKGSGGPKAAFSDVQYLGDILKKNNFTPAKAYAVGGVRIQSFSDYVPRLVFDYLQMVGDLAAKKLPAHAYTKEATFAKQFGMTGIKVNLSLVPAIAKDGVAPGLDKKGDYYWFDGQSFGSDVNVKGSGKTGFEMAVKIQNAPGYSAHCGTIAVGVSDAHIWKMLDDNDIRMIIPYHKSSLNHIVAVMNNIDQYKDYTGVQNTRLKSTGSKITGKDFNFNEALRRTGDAKAAANEYLAWCDENGYIPKFDTFARHENYYKVLEDFSTYDNGVATPQGAVTMTFPKDGDAFGSMAQLIQEGLEEDAILEGRRDKSVPEIVDKVGAVLKEGKKQYSLKDSDYLSAVKRGDMETAQRMVAAFARESGYTPVKRYHQTAGGFTKFSTANPRAGLNDSETPNGIFFKDNDHDIGLEGKTQLQVYLKADNMLHFHNREEANKWYCDNVDGYEPLQDEYNAALKPFLDELDEIEKKMFDSATTDDEYDALYEREGSIIEEMREVEDSYRGQLRELLNEHFLNGTSGYDGIELDYDGHRWVNGKREDVHTYIVFDPAQAKSADPVTYDDNGNVIPLSKRFDSSNEDIRYSLKGQSDLLDENAKLRETNIGLQKLFESGKVVRMDKKSMTDLARSVLKENSSGADINETRDTLTRLYEYLVAGENGERGTWETAYKQAYDIATEVLTNAVEVDDTLYQEYKALRDYLKNTPIKLEKSDEGDLGGFESLAEFRKAYIGRLKLRNDGIPVGAAYQELAGLYPDLFDADDRIHPAEQLVHIGEVLDSLRPVEYNPHSYTMRDSATWLANDIMMRFYRFQNDKLVAAIKRGNEKATNERKRYMERRTEAVQKVKEHYKAKESKASESKKRQILRAKVLRHVQQMDKKLRKGTDKNNVPEALKGAVAELLASINLESNRTRDPETGSYKKYDEGIPSRRTEEFRKVKAQYEAIAANNEHSMVLDPNLLGVPAEGIQSMLDKVIAMQDTRLVDMNLDQLQTVYDVLRVMEHSITTAGKMLTRARWASIHEAADHFKDDTDTRKTKRTGGKLLDIETPYTFFSHYGEAGKAFYRMLRNAQDAEQGMQDQLRDRLGNVVSLEERQKAEKQTVTYTTQRGVELTLSKAHVMNIYLLNKRKQAQQHLLHGGIVQPEIGKVKKGTEAVLLTEWDVANIVSKLSAEERRMAEGLQKLTLLMAEWGNEASMTVYGIKKFGDPDYWTIHSSDIGINQTVEQGQNKPRSIANMGSAKAVIPEATNTLEIGSAFDVFDRHASDMMCYSAWLAPMEDANRLFNYKYRDSNWNPTGKTIKGILERVGGEGSTKYWLRLMEDIQNGLSAPADTASEQVTMKAIGNVKKASVSGNIRVVVQQPTAFARAAVVLGPDTMLASLGKDVAVKPMMDGWKKAVKYAPIAARKAAGGYEVAANPKQLAELLYQPKSAKGKAVKGMKESPLWLAGVMDQATWGTIWNACEMQVGKKMKKGTDAFYETVSELFTEVIDQTQVVDGVLQRSQVMRSGSNFMKQMTAFTGEPTQGANMIIRAYDQLRYEQNPKKRGQAMKKLGRAVGVFMFTAVLNAFAQSLVDGLRDDDDEEYWDKVWAAFSGINGKEETWWDFTRNILLASNVANNINPMGWVPVWKDVLSVIQGYSVERMDAASLGDFFTSLTNVVKTLEGDGKYTTGYAALKSLTLGHKLLGGSSYNYLRDIEGVVRTFQVETDDYMARYETMKLMTKPGNNLSEYAALLYKAYENDQAAYKQMYNDLVASGVDQEKIKDKMEGLMKKAQGVTKVDELKQRYLSPSQQPVYDKKLKAMKGNDLWSKATADQRDKVEDKLYGIVTGSDKDALEKLNDGASFGLDDTEYLLYSLALEMADQPNDNGNLGTYTSAEKAAAILDLGMGDSETAFLWDTKEGYEAFADGVDMGHYVEFKAGVAALVSGEDYEKGDTDSRKAAIKLLLRDMGLSADDSDYAWLYHTEYKK